MAHVGTRTMALVGVAVVVAGLGACQSSRIEGLGAVEVVSQCKPDRIAAGETAEVACTILNGHGLEVQGVTSFTVAPAEGRTISGVGVTPTVAGTYTAACSAPEYGLVDTLGDELIVDPAAPALITTVLGEETIPVYTTTAVTCVVEDEYGNLVPITAGIEAPEEVVVGDGVVSSAEVGTYEIACALPDHPDVEVVAAELDVIPADPAQVELFVKPDTPVYYLESKADFWWVVTDVHGNVINGLPATFTIPDEDVQVIDEPTHVYRLMAEGHFTFTVTLEPPWDALSDSRTLVVDESGPEIVITWPTRGETVEGDGDFLTVSGYVVDAWSELEFFELNGEEVELEADGSFETIMLPAWGVNLIQAYAEDEHGNPTKLTPSFAYSSSWLSYEGTTPKDVVRSDAVALLLGQRFLDDGDHDHSKLDDLATLLEVILGDIDIAELVAGFGSFDLVSFPIIDQDVLGGALHLGGELVVTASVVDPTDIGPTMVTIDSRLGGVDSIIEFGDAEEPGMIVTLALSVEVPLSVSWTVFGGGEITALGSAALLTEAQIASLILGTKLDIQKPTLGELEVAVAQLTLDIAALEIDPIEDIVLHFELDLGFWNPAFDLSLSDLVGDISQLTDQFLDPITTQFVPFLLDLLTPLIEGFVDDIILQVLALTETELPLPLPDLLGLGGGEPTEVTIATELSSVMFFPEQVDGLTGQIVHDGGGQIGLGLGMHADQGVDREPLGAIERAGCLKGADDNFMYDWERSLGAALKTDFLNAAAFAIWWSGYLNGPLDLGGLLGGGGLPIPVSGLSLEMEWLLPPVVNDCGKSFGIELQIGDLFAKVEGELLGSPIAATIYVDAALAVFFEAGEGGLSVTVGEFRYFDVEVLSVSQDITDLLDIKDLLENGLEPLLADFVVGQTFGPIEIPPIDLGGLLPGLPEGVALQLGDLDISPDQGYVVISGNLK